MINFDDTNILLDKLKEILDKLAIKEKRKNKLNKIMGTYWDDFLKEYKDVIFKRNLVEILEAFWYYSNQKQIKCDEIMNKK